MALNTEIEIKSGEENLKLIVSESILLVNKYDQIRITLPIGTPNWVLVLLFEDDDNKKANTTETIFNENNDIIIKHNKWYSDSLENIEPYLFSSKNKQINIKVKIRTSASEKLNFRHVILSVWQKME